MPEVPLRDVTQPPGVLHTDGLIESLFGAPLCAERRRHAGRFTECRDGVAGGQMQERERGAGRDHHDQHALQRAADEPCERAA